MLTYADVWPIPLRLHSCGFQGSYADVAAHELTCQFAPAMTATATHELACPLAPGGIVQGPPHDATAGHELACPLAQGDGGKDAGSSVAENEATDLKIAKELGEGNVALEEEHKLSRPVRCIRWNVAAQKEQQQQVIAEVEAGDELAGDELAGGAYGTHAAEEQGEAPRATSSADVGVYLRICGTDAPKEAAEEAAEESACASKRQHTSANVSSIRQQTSAAEGAHKALHTTSSSSSGLNAEQLQPGQHQHPAAPAGNTDQQRQQHRPAEQLQHRPAEQLQHRLAEQQQPAQSSSNSSGLNTEQQQAAQHPAREPLMILAGAGSGKTKTLISRMQHLKDHGIPLSKILVLTFSTAATKELTSRVANAFGGE